MNQIMKCKMKIFKKLINKSLKILLILNNKRNEIKNKNKLKTLIKMMKMNKQMKMIQLININNF